MIRLEPRPQPSKLLSFTSPLLALAITVLIGVALFVLLGKDPLRGLQVFFVEPVKSLYALSELSIKATPLVLIALGLAVCFRSNVWNIGAEGQFVLGAIAGGGVALLAGKERIDASTLDAADYQPPTVRRRRLPPAPRPTPTFATPWSASVI